MSKKSFKKGARNAAADFFITPQESSEDIEDTPNTEDAITPESRGEVKKTATPKKATATKQEKSAKDKAEDIKDISATQDTVTIKVESLFDADDLKIDLPDYRINLKLKGQYKSYLDQVSWENRTSITQYLNDLIEKDMQLYIKRNKL